MGQIKNIKLHIVTDIKNTRIKSSRTDGRDSFDHNQNDVIVLVPVGENPRVLIPECADDSRDNILCQALVTVAMQRPVTCAPMVSVSLCPQCERCRYLAHVEGNICC